MINLLNQFQINEEEVIGKGAYSIVYKGHQTKKKKTYAVKRINLKDYKEKGYINLKWEIEILEQIENKNIVKYQ